MSFKSWAKQYARKHKFTFTDFNTNHCRVSNGKKYVDFWANGSYRTIDGRFENSFTNGFNIYQDENMYFEVKKEIFKLLTI